MGLFWDLIQQSQISSQHSRAESLENRVGELEREIVLLQSTMRELLTRLEKYVGQDIDGDGSVG